jgi:hypothetical protein
MGVRGSGAFVLLDFHQRSPPLSPDYAVDPDALMSRPRIVAMPRITNVAAWAVRSRHAGRRSSTVAGSLLVP